MLKQLQINNVALVDSANMTFGPGLNVITGETGAGKSILVGSIGLALGDRAHPDVVSTREAEVIASFEDSSGAHDLRRVVRPDGRTKAWIDGENSTIGALKEEASRWVELTAQREGITLLENTTHLRHLDRFAGLSADTERLVTFHARWQAMTAQLSGVEQKIARMKQSEELAEFQLREIEEFDPKPGEDEELDNEIRLLEGAENLIVGLGEAVDRLDQGEEPLSDSLAEVIGRIKSLSRIDQDLEGTAETLDEALEGVRQAALDLADRRDGVNLDPERLEVVRERHDRLNELMRKYGGSIQLLLQTRDDLRGRSESTEELQRLARQLKRQIADHLESWEALLQRVSKRRREAAPGMNTELENGLKSVGVTHPVFAIEWQDEEGDLVEFPTAGERRVGPQGWDVVEFMVSFNPGHSPKPLARVASGGELSRVMLLLKGLDPPEGNPPVLIFDEIDTGISGKTARQVGLRLKELAQIRQVILVTHLAQIASLADHHVIVEKVTEPGSTEVTVREVGIGSPEQIDEIARLVGGDQITDAARTTARELIGK
jgi:DNA repair protein RecN (Recombination protein N)